MNKNKLKFKYSLPRPLRSNKGYCVINTTQDIKSTPTAEILWFMKAEGNKYYNSWVTEKFLDENIRNTNIHYIIYSNQPCSCLRKFKKILRKNPHIIGKVVLQSNEYLDDYEFDIESIM